MNLFCTVHTKKVKVPIKFIIAIFLRFICIILFIGKADIQRGETERKIFRPMIHSPSERNGRCHAGPKLGVSFGSPTRVQGPKALGHPRLLSQSTGRELEGKRGCWDRTGAHMGSRACKARTPTTCATAPGPARNCNLI